MRIELSGSHVEKEALIVRFDVNGTFDTASYIDQGYTHFDVICIGAGGGTGGGIDTANTGTQLKSWGGAGGGGGYQRVRGLLSALPSSCPVVVGVGGGPGTSHASNPASTTDGVDGGFSTFNTNTCRASGGKGGKRVQSNSNTVTTQAHGGDGGAGNRTTAGGGALGGQAGTPALPGPGVAGTPGADGTFAYDLGTGGGGGAGGVGKYGGTTLNNGTPGGRGSYNPGDLSVYGPAGAIAQDPTTFAFDVVPGGASGAKAAPLTGLPTIYGQSKGNPTTGANGVVVIRLTTE